MPSERAERFYLDQFIQAEGWHVTDIEQRHPPDPDFVMRLDGRLIGVEVTGAYRDPTSEGSQAHTDELRREKFLRRVATEYYARSGPSARVHATFHRTFKDPESVRVAEVLLAHVPSLPSTEVKCEIEEGLSIAATFSILRLPDNAEPFRRWTAIDNQVGWGKRIDAGFFSSIVTNKSTKLPGYKLTAPEVVLLIHIDGMRVSGFLHLENEPMVLAESGGFDAVYLYKHPGKSHRLA